METPQTEIDNSFKSEILGALGDSPRLFRLVPLNDEVFSPHLKKESSYDHARWESISKWTLTPLGNVAPSPKC